jgi:hypothetical protein
MEEAELGASHLTTTNTMTLNKLKPGLELPIYALVKRLEL